MKARSSYEPFKTGATFEGDPNAGKPGALGLALNSFAMLSRTGRQGRKGAARMALKSAAR